MSYQAGLNMLLGAISGGAIALKKGFKTQGTKTPETPNQSQTYTPSFYTPSPEEVQTYATFKAQEIIRSKRNIRYNKANRMKKRGMI